MHIACSASNLSNHSIGRSQENQTYYSASKFRSPPRSYAQAQVCPSVESDDKLPHFNATNPDVQTLQQKCSDNPPNGIAQVLDCSESKSASVVSPNKRGNPISLELETIQSQACNTSHQATPLADGASPESQIKGI